MGRRCLVGIIALALIAGVAVEFINNDRGADAVALREASLLQPPAHWSVLRRSFEPWATDVTKGSVRIRGSSGPVWVLELSAPGDSSWQSYRALVVVSAVTGSMSASDVLANN